MISFFCWLVFGFLGIRLAVTLFNFFTFPILPTYRQSVYSERAKPKSISILIPARNEEKNISNLLNNLLKLNDLRYFNYEIIVLNDHSTDYTYTIVNELSNKNEYLKLIEGNPLPEDWLGKNWACHQLATAANGNLLLFIDADVVLKDGVLMNAVKRLEEQNLDLLSLFPEQKMETFGEKMIVPLMHFLLLNLLPLRLVRTTSNASLSAANGQFMLFKATSYRHFLFHEKVKDNVLDDVNIMRFLKSCKGKGEVLLGNNQVFCRMYMNGNEAFKGFGKNLFPGFGKNILGFQMYFIFIFWLWIPFWYLADWRLGLLSVFLIVLERVLISRLANQSIIQNLLFHPLQMILYTCIGWYSMYLHITNKVEWKGRKVQ